MLYRIKRKLNLSTGALMLSKSIKAVGEEERDFFLNSGEKKPFCAFSKIGLVRRGIQLAESQNEIIDLYRHL